MGYVQDTGTYWNGSSATSTFAVPVTNLPSVGNTLIAFAKGSSSGTYTVTDPRGNTWTQDVYKADSGPSLTLFHCQVVTAYQSGDTITFTSSTSVGNQGVHIIEVSGLESSNPVDQSAYNAATSVTSLTVVLASPTTNANDFLVTGICSGGSSQQTYTAPGGSWTEDYFSGTGMTMDMAYQQATATGTFSTTWAEGGTATMVAILAAYKPAGASFDLYSTSTNDTTISTARELSTTAPASETSVAATGAIAKNATGWIELASQGGTATTLGSSEPAPSGDGFLWDVTTLEGKQVVAGNWSASVKIAEVSGKGVTADIHLRVFKWNASTGYTQFTSGGVATDLVLTAQSITTTATVYAIPSTALDAMNFATGDKLYIDIILDITTGDSYHAGSGGFDLYENGGANESLATPGYKSAGAFTQSLTATLSSVGTESKQMSGTLVASMTASTAMAVVMGYVLSGVVSASGVLLRRTGAVLAAIFQPAFSRFSRQTDIHQVATVGSSTALRRAVASALSGLTALPGNLVHSGSTVFHQVLSAAIIASASISNLAQKTLGGVGSFAGRIGQMTGVALTATSRSAGVLARRARKGFVAVGSAAGSLARSTKAGLAAASVSPVGLLAAHLSQVFLENLVAVLSASASLRKATRSRLTSAVSSLGGTLSRRTDLVTTAVARGIGSLGKRVGNRLAGAFSLLGGLVTATSGRTSVVLNAVFGPAGVLNRSSAIGLVGAVVGSLGNLARRTTTFPSALMHSAGAIAKQVRNTLFSTLHPTAILARRVSASLVASMGLASQVARRTSTQLVGYLGVLGNLSTRSAGRVYQVLSASLGSAGAISRSTAARFGAGIVAGGALVRRSLHRFTGTASTLGSLVTSTSRQIAKVLSAAVAFAGNEARSTRVAVGAGVSLTGLIGRNVGTKLAGVYNTSGNLARKTGRHLAIATVRGSGLLVRLPGKALQGTVGGAATIGRTVGKGLAAGVGATGAIRRGIRRAIGAIFGPEGLLSEYLLRKTSPGDSIVTDAPAGQSRASDLAASSTNTYEITNGGVIVSDEAGQDPATYDLGPSPYSDPNSMYDY